MKSKTSGWSRAVQERTERFLTWRKRRKIIKKEKQRRKNPILDWTEVILSAVFIVLLINQYLFQAYQIPSGSMEDTLRIGDRIFVNKMIYGPELVPGMYKIDGPVDPKRGEIVIFQNPTYLYKGPLFDIVHRVLYMITFTFVDIDRDEQGNVAVHFLIKRVIGVPGDRLRVRRGDMEFRLAGESEWIGEAELKERYGFDYPTHRLFDRELYGPLETRAIGAAQQDAGVQPRVDMAGASSRLAGSRFPDQYFFQKNWNRTRYQISPDDRRYGGEWRRREMGWYVGTQRVFPMGDNRDNSRDARYFHAVDMSDVLGRYAFRFFSKSWLGGSR